MALAHAAQDAHGVDALMHMQAHGVHFKGGALGLARPLQIGRAHALQGLQGVAHGGGVVARQGIGNQRVGLGAGGVELQGRVQVGVVGPAGFGLLGVAFGVNEADFGVVLAPVGVTVGQHLGAARVGLVGGRFGFGYFGWLGG
ncbi:MAG: hypothetical protein BGO74_14165 [Burkholderiales bacterium 68-12]|nr:MAG: hypothetical protein BGO74_14165 [Burkholderiales bacterium 68-12]